MAISRMAGDSSSRSELEAPLRRLRDQIIDLYLDWLEETAAVADAYASWSGAPAGEEGRRFAAYAAALDREEAAARGYADALANGERLSQGGGAP
ncbi:MAG TPA: hypothetical protein VHH91_03615 [Vicinamibacterales bacterium]|nr:hypothetical protein [Vicinamibacterales bacterium]